MKCFRCKVTKLIAFFVVGVVMLELASVFFHAHAEVPSLSARSAVLIELESGRVLLEKNANSRMGMASTTKIMTALTALTLAKPEDILTVPKGAVGIEGSSVYLTAGERLSVRELLYALLLSSANDAAAALALCLSGSIEAFADKMNECAAALGLKDTHFVNPHGLYDGEHYTTAYELALITREALKNDTLAKIFATYKTNIPLCGKENGRLLVNHNKLLRTYEGAIGVKTGFTKKTGRCLVGAARRDGMTLISVTLNAPDDWRDHTAMLDYGFAGYCRAVLYDIGEYKYSLPLAGSEDSFVTLTNTKPLCLMLPKGNIQAELSVYSSMRFAYPPVRKGFVYATVRVCADGQTADSPLVPE